jgi:hypothetical protein
MEWGGAAMMRFLPGALGLLVLSGATAHANLVIGSKPTENMSCSGGVCAPTAREATLNVTDLENMLASQAVEITTTGTNVQAENIVIAAPFGWVTTNGLALQAYRSILIDAPVSIGGAASFTISTYDGALSFGKKGRVGFQDLSSALTINGTSFTLVDTVATLSRAVASDPAGVFAFAAPYDASGDGTYSHAPVTADLSGVLEGLGNTISNLTIDDPRSGENVGLFAEVSGTVRDVGLAGANVRGGKNKTDQAEEVGALVGLLEAGGAVSGSSASGTATTGGGLLGGLIGASFGDVRYSHAKVNVSIAGADSFAGGLIGISFGSVEQSFSTGSVESTASGYFGGFVGQNAEGTIVNSYARGAVSASNNEAALGGFAGTAADSSINESYATGSVSGGDAYAIGGFTGTGGYGFTNDYWDVTTSGQTNGTGSGNMSGITGLTTAQLQSGLPGGFPPDVWAQKKGVNKDFPYIIGNLP